MEVWKIIWIVTLVIAFIGFIFLSSKVIWRGLTEMKELLKGLDE